MFDCMLDILTLTFNVWFDPNFEVLSNCVLYYADTQKNVTVDTNKTLGENFGCQETVAGKLIGPWSAYGAFF